MSDPNETLPQVIETTAIVTHDGESYAGDVDIQVSTAHRFPRTLGLFKRELLDASTEDEATAAAMFYTLPGRGGKKDVEGESIRFAEAVASAWGHLRQEVGTLPIGPDDRFVTGTAMVWDLQKNVALKTEVKVRITNKKGERFGDDMIVTTSNAAISKALRNAILRVVPKAAYRAAYDAAKEASTGKGTMPEKRMRAVEAFKAIKVKESQMLGIVGVEALEDVTNSGLVKLRGVLTAIKDGDTTLTQILGKDKARKSNLVGGAE